jgi:hypothetical protein
VLGVKPGKQQTSAKLSCSKLEIDGAQVRATWGIEKPKLKPGKRHTSAMLSELKLTCLDVILVPKCTASSVNCKM